MNKLHVEFQVLNNKLYKKKNFLTLRILFQRPKSSSPSYCSPIILQLYWTIILAGDCLINLTEVPFILSSFRSWGRRKEMWSSEQRGGGVGGLEQLE